MPDTGCPIKNEKSYHLVWHKNKDKLLFFYINYEMTYIHLDF